jgi:hypothetical protein
MTEVNMLEQTFYLIEHITINFVLLVITYLILN